MNPSLFDAAQALQVLPQIAGAINQGQLTLRPTAKYAGAAR